MVFHGVVWAVHVQLDTLGGSVLAGLSRLTETVLCSPPMSTMKVELSFSLCKPYIRLGRPEGRQLE